MNTSLKMTDVRNTQAIQVFLQETQTGELQSKSIFLDESFDRRQINTIIAFVNHTLENNSNAIYRLLHFLTCLNLQNENNCLFGNLAPEKKFIEFEYDEEKCNDQITKDVEFMTELFERCYFALTSKMEDALTLYFSKEYEIDRNKLTKIFQTAKFDAETLPDGLLYLPSTNQWQVCIVNVPIS